MYSQLMKKVEITEVKLNSYHQNVDDLEFSTRVTIPIGCPGVVIVVVVVVVVIFIQDVIVVVVVVVIIAVVVVVVMVVVMIVVMILPLVNRSLRDGPCPVSESRFEVAFLHKHPVALIFALATTSAIRLIF